MLDAVYEKRDVIYCEGPGDIASSYKSWKSGAHLVSETSVTFSGQVFDFCKGEDFSLLAISCCSRPESILDGDFAIVNLPRRHIGLPRLGYHLSLLLYALRLLGIAVRVRPRYILLSSGVVGWTFASVLRLSGAKIVLILHNTVWPEGFPPRGIPALVRGVTRRLMWRYCIWRTLAVSPAAKRQAQEVMGELSAKSPPPLVFKPIFPRADFLIAPPASDFHSRPFRVLYASRVEENKGAIDLLSIAQSLNSGEFEFDVCGEGGAYHSYREQVRARGLEGIVRVHGRLPRPELLQRYLAAHVVIVPTRSSFEEGFAMVAAEAVLLLRPVITCSVVPASEVLSPATLLCRADDVESYVNTIRQLSQNEFLYHGLVEQARLLHKSILDEATSLRSTLQKLISSQRVE